MKEWKERNDVYAIVLRETLIMRRDKHGRKLKRDDWDSWQSNFLIKDAAVITIRTYI